MYEDQILWTAFCQKIIQICCKIQTLQKLLSYAYLLLIVSTLFQKPFSEIFTRFTLEGLKSFIFSCNVFLRYNIDDFIPLCVSMVCNFESQPEVLFSKKLVHQLVICDITLAITIFAITLVCSFLLIMTHIQVKPIYRDKPVILKKQWSKTFFISICKIQDFYN